MLNDLTERECVPGGAPPKLATRGPGRSVLLLIGAFLAVFAVTGAFRTGIQAAAAPLAGDSLIAIDVLLEPDQAMVARAHAVNDRLRGNHPNGYSLDASHAPHVTLLQRFVRARDLEAVTSAIAKLLTVERPAELRLKANGIVYTVSAGVAVTLIAIERTPELMRLHQQVADAVAPFTASGGTAAAFVETPPGADIVAYVETFVPKASGANYFPHITAGVAAEDFVKQMKAEPFDPVTFSPRGVAIYQLGNFGTASKRLWPGQASGGEPTVSKDPLASWNDVPSRQAILDFVRRVTTAGSPDFVPAPERIAVFDNDGTLWAEQPPISIQGAFLFERVRALAPRHPEWKDTQPFKGVIENDLKAVAAAGEAGLIDMIVATHSGMTTDEFDRMVKDWLATARHPKFNRPYTDLVYAPMVELLAFLRANDFKTFIVSGGGVEFMRTVSERLYGIPPEQVIGSSIALKYEIVNGTPVLTRQPRVDFIDDKEGKVVGIQKAIGRRPIAAFGNSDGDFAMLEWVTSGSGPRFGLLVHHTDGVREYAYDRGSVAGRLERGLDEAKTRGWTMVDMKQDWNRVFSFQK